VVGGKKGKKENEKEEVEFEVRHVGPMRKEVIEENETG